MIYENRRKGFYLMHSFWLMAAAIVCIQFLTGGDIVFLLGAVFMTGIFQLIGAFIYLGHVGIFGNFSFMTSDELRGWDLKKFSSFLGMSFVLIAFVSLLASFLALITIGDKNAFAALVVLGIIPFLVCSFYASLAKRFRVKQ